MAMMPNTFVTVVWSFLGAIVLATGVLDVIEASRAKGQGSSLAGLAFVFGCFTAVLGMVLIMSPFLFSELAMLIAAIVLLIDGVSELVFGLGL
jgi:uncharacterized membrane protein HdeD (DUF308 family)